MLRARILTAAVLAPLLLAALFKLPDPALATVLGLIVLAAAWEWSTLLWRAALPPRLLFLFVAAVSGIVVYLFPVTHFWLIGLAAIWWLWVLVELWRQERSASRHDPGARYGAIAGWFTLVPAWLAVVLLAGFDAPRPWLLLSLLLVVWSADIGAYFTGRALGRHRLAPQLSPGKTLEGLAGGLVAALLAALLLGTLFWRYPMAELVPWLALCTMAALFSVIGDLYESLQKRRAGVKDSGRLLPGHGGILDRIDSVTAAAPTFLAGWLLLTLAR